MCPLRNQDWVNRCPQVSHLNAGREEDAATDVDCGVPGAGVSVGVDVGVSGVAVTGLELKAGGNAGDSEEGWHSCK